MTVELQDGATTVSTAPLVVLDADSTLLRDEAIELLAEEAGCRDAVARVTERAMRGELDFAESLRERVRTLAGLETRRLEAVTARMRPNPGAEELIGTVHAAGGRVCVVSGGFHELLDPVAEALGVDRWRANRLERRNGVLTGAVEGPIVDAETKTAMLREWASEFGVRLRRVVAVGDGANDLHMMADAGLSVAFNAKPAVRAAADVTAGRVDLSDILPLIGLRG